MKIHDSDSIESIMVEISKDKTPKVYEARLKSYIDSGLSVEESEKIASSPIQMEIYYDPNNGLFGIESESIESGSVSNPYTREFLTENN